ncbi:MAG: hypothetical protein KAR30_10265 [Gammaproteobacteria bacterium]|nr:hypothetical protein [Gammaproteobacteria bacterium]
MNHNPAPVGSNYAQPVGNGIVFLVLTVISIIYVQWTWTDLLGQFGGDNAWYLHMAKYLSPFTSPSDTTKYFAQHSPYPPLIPIILALTGGAESLLVAHLTTTLFLLGSFLMLYIFAIQLIGSRLIAIGIVLVFATLAMTYMHALEILSENYYLLFCLLSIVLAGYSEKNKKNIGVLMAVSLLAGSSFLIRSAGLSMIAAFTVYIWINYPREWRIKLYMIMLSPYILSKVFDFKSGESFSYISMMSGKLSLFHSLNDVVSHMGAHIGRFINAWFNIFSATTNVGVIVVGILGILSLIGLANRVRKKHLDGLYLFFYILLLLLWPFSPEAERYLYPVTALMLGHAVYIVHLWVKNIRIGGLAKGALIAVLLINNMPALAFTYDRYTSALPEDFSEYRHAAIWYGNKRQVDYRGVIMIQTLTEAMKAIKQAVPEDQCVYSIKPSIVGMYSGRVSIQPPLEKLSDQEFLHDVSEKGCQYFFILPFSSISYRAPFYPVNRIKGFSEQIFSVSRDEVSYAALYKLKN